MLVGNLVIVSIPKSSVKIYCDNYFINTSFKMHEYKQKIWHKVLSY